MLLSPRKNGLTFLFKEFGVFKERGGVLRYEVAGVLQYRLEVYCGMSLHSKLSCQQGTSCDTNWRRCIAVLFRQVARVGGS